MKMKVADVHTVTAAWEQALAGFKSYLALERSMSVHTIEAYLRDTFRLTEYLSVHEMYRQPVLVTKHDLFGYGIWLGKMGIAQSTQARMLSGVRAFYKYLLIDDQINDDPTAFLDSPKLNRYIPDILTLDEIQQMLGAIDLSTDLGVRNRAMLEVLYACGLRVSELINFRLEDYYPEDQMVRVIGKNNKQRIVPIGQVAIKYINTYLVHVRQHKQVKKGNEPYLFLNRNGAKLTRVMVFYIIKELALEIQLEKEVSPHTFRHSFATHLVEGGADLKAVQDMLGHESITTTEIYTHLDTDYLRETIQLFHPRSQTKPK
jgi:integrase/recombinase XerD